MINFFAYTKKQNTILKITILFSDYKSTIMSIHLYIATFMTFSLLLSFIEGSYRPSELPINYIYIDHLALYLLTLFKYLNPPPIPLP